MLCVWPARGLRAAAAVLQGMLHLHLCDPPIIHRDLKSPNLLVDKHWKLKVCSNPPESRVLLLYA